MAQDENLREGKWIFEAADGMGRLFLGVVADIAGESGKCSKLIANGELLISPAPALSEA